MNNNSPKQIVTNDFEMHAVPTAQELRELVGSQARAAREMRGLSLRESSRQLDISPSFLSEVETGSKNISLELLFKMSKSYRVSVDALLGRERIEHGNGASRLFEAVRQFFLMRAQMASPMAVVPRDFAPPPRSPVRSPSSSACCTAASMARASTSRSRL